MHNTRCGSCYVEASNVGLHYWQAPNAGGFDTSVAGTDVVAVDCGIRTAGTLEACWGAQTKATVISSSLQLY